MKRKLFTIFIISLILIFSTYCKKAVKGKEEILKMLPKESAGIIFVNIERISGTKFFRELTSTNREKIEKWGIDPEKDIHFVGIAISGKIMPGKKTAGLVVMNVDYKKELILSNLKKEGLDIAEEKYKNALIISGIDKKNKDLRMAFIGNNFLGIGNEELLKKAIDLKAGKGENILKNSQLMSLVKDLNQESFLWGASLIPRKDIKGMLEKNPQAKIFESIKAVSFFMDYNNTGYQGELNLHSDDEAKINQMADFLNGIKAMISMGKSQSPELQELLSGINISAEPTRVKVAVNLTEDLIMKLKKEAEKKK